MSINIFQEIKYNRHYIYIIFRYQNNGCNEIIIDVFSYFVFSLQNLTAKSINILRM